MEDRSWEDVNRVIKSGKTIQDITDHQERMRIRGELPR